MNIVTHNGVLNMFYIATVRYAKVYIFPSVFFNFFITSLMVRMFCCGAVIIKFAELSQVIIT